MKQMQIAGAVFTLILGSLLHFSYDWSGENAIVGIFSATNESTWEHLKLLAMPIFLFGIAEYFAYGRKMSNFIPVKMLSVLIGMGVIVTVFYTYVGIVGQHFLWADIAAFVLGVAAAYWFSSHFLSTSSFYSVYSLYWGWLGLAVIFICFALFSFYSPHIGLFLDPVSNSYGSAPVRGCNNLTLSK